MDKETLSNYGWIVIAVLVLVVMIALAGPFGNFVSEAVQSTTKGLFDVNKNALDAADIPIDNQEFDVPDMNNGAGNGGAETPEVVVDHNGATIPEGAIYTKADGTVLNAGDAFPATPTTGDKYVYGDYEYRYNQIYTLNIMPSYSWAWNTYEAMNGWDVHVLDTNKTSYGEIIDCINGKTLNRMTSTFAYCSSMTEAPEIPDSVTSLGYTFYFPGVTSVRYEGTKAQFREISRGANWYTGGSKQITSVVCSDGVLLVDSVGALL